MEWWQVAAGANGVVALSYFAISWALFRPLHRAGEFGSNRLGTATALIFLTCAIGHALHGLHPLLPLIGVEGEQQGSAQDVAFHDAAWAVLTAAVGVYYWSLRRSYGRLLEGATLFRDNATRRREAVEVNDGVVQALVAAKLARHLGQDAEVDAALDAALESSRELVGRLLHDSPHGPRPAAGDFVRGRPGSDPR